jgi:HprK-related kinase A
MHRPLRQITDCSEAELDALLRHDGIALDFGAVRSLVRANVPGLAKALRRTYGAFDIDSPTGIFDVVATLRPAKGIRRYLRRQIELVVDGSSIFEPFPSDTHLPLLEWGTNFLIAERSAFHLLLHAGVVERDGRAVILPAVPGSGKSTLTAALATRGFRLLSDEFGVVRLSDGMLLPLLRPIALKNASIDVISRYAPDESIGPAFPRTRKGTVAHLAPSRDAFLRRAEPAEPVMIVFPQFNPAVEFALRAERPGRAFTRLAVNSFNYEMLGPVAFEAVAGLIDRCGAFDLVYSDLDRAVGAIGDLVAQAS